MKQKKPDNNMELNLNDLLRQYRADPYEYFNVVSPHTGIVTFKVKEGDLVKGPSGKWHQKPGTLLFYLERERNQKPVYATGEGEVCKIDYQFDGKFVEAGQPLISIRHKLSKEEIIDRILTKVLYIFAASQKARYFLAPEIANKIEGLSESSKAIIEVKPGDEIITMSLMKRDTPVIYDGPEGVIYKVYFNSGQMVEENEPLIGVCPPDKLPFVKRVIERIKTEWED